MKQSFEERQILRPAPISITDAIYAYRPVHSFDPEPLPDASLHALIYAAVQAPAFNREPWAFAVIKNKELLRSLSVTMPASCEAGLLPSCQPASVTAFSCESTGNVFHNAGTLVVIYARVSSDFIEADCWLAAGNLVLAARGMGLGSCFVRSAIADLNSPRWKALLDIPAEMTAIAPIALGQPLNEDASFQPPAPEILSWSADR